MIELSPSEIAARLAGEKNNSCLDDTSVEGAPGNRFPTGLLEGPPRPAAVLVPFIYTQPGWEILFTRRTDSLVEHSGQVAFPGGQADPQDTSPEETALREAYEEIGLHPGQARVLGRLDSFLTISNYCITPIVASIEWPFKVHLASQEVKRIFTIPLEWLADPNNHEIKMRRLPAPYPPAPVIYFKPFDGEVLWGVSAFITINLLEQLAWRSESR